MIRTKNGSHTILACLLLVSTTCHPLSSSAFVPFPLEGRTGSRLAGGAGPEERKQFTLKDLREEIQKNPEAFLDGRSKTKSKYRRTRKRVANPQQHYVYARRREAEGEGSDGAESVAVEREALPVALARDYGLTNPAGQHCDAPMDGVEPKILGQIRVGEERKSGSYAYVIHKPAGWSVIGGMLGNKTAGPEQGKQHVSKPETTDRDRSTNGLEFAEADILAVMTPEEIEEYKREQMINEHDLEEMPPQEGGDVLATTPEQTDMGRPIQSDALDEKTKEVLRKVEARKSASKIPTASFASFSRPSVVGWLKDLKAQEGSPMKGGKHWTALAGATDVDDSGIVIICPKDHVENVFVDYLEYVAVVGNDKYLASKPKGVVSIPNNEMTVDLISSLRKGRKQDIVQTVKVMVPEKMSSCSGIVQACQQQFLDGIRGDPAGNPFGRLANRRLLHCNAVSVSSLVFEESVTVETEGMPDDIAILAERRHQHRFQRGSFLGRSALNDNPLTTAYREINGAADGFPGWTVDRYDKWLLVQHDETMPRGPLPSIHDGSTAGVYYLPANPDRNAMGSSPAADGALTRPRLLEGQPAPDRIPVLENGVIYHVSLDKDLSTGIFLDQRPQRAWLSRNCNENTHVLNCFAHCGAFSIAAATAGASTTSLDLNKKWLDRVEPQLNANGIEFDVRHDCIHGDCFEWLSKLAKRGEKYDIVILDPPSASVGGGEKKRWSIKSDMPELVALAAKVVKKGGLLWTTTNSASLSPVKFARLCRQGLEDAGHSSACLEKIQPMPHDFPTIGPQPVKNLVWRLP